MGTGQQQEIRRYIMSNPQKYTKCLVYKLSSSGSVDKRPNENLKHKPNTSPIFVFKIRGSCIISADEVTMS